MLYTSIGDSMNNPFPYSFDNKRYYTWNYYLQNRFGKKIAKVPLDANFTCPNRDGTKSVGGCTFCSAKGSGDFPIASQADLLAQFHERYTVMAHKWPNCGAIAYFQSYTNTYAPLDAVARSIEPFLKEEMVEAIAIATRCDCLSDECIEYLESCTTQKEIWVELGLQSIHEETAIRTNRAHDLATFASCVEKLSHTHLKICVHVINGFPWETKEDMLETVQYLAHQPIHALKIHMLHLLKDAKMGKEYLKNPYPLLTREEYVQIVVDQLELLPPTMILQRLTGDGMADDLIGPEWTIKKTIVLNEIDKEMARRNSWQGKRYQI